MKRKIFLTISVILAVACFMTSCRESKQIEEDLKMDTAVIEKANTFGKELVCTIAEKKDTFFVSPLSVYMALAALSEGAEEKAYDELKEILYPKEMQEDVFRKANKAIFESFAQKKECTLFMSTLVAAKKAFNTDFSAAIRENYSGEAMQLDLFSQESVEQINKWASEKTNGMIENFFAEPPYCDAVLLNSIYFLGKWKEAFREDEVQEGLFYGKNGTTSAEFMQNTKSRLYYDGETMQAVRLAYEGGCYMNIYLPKDDNTPAALLEQTDVAFTETELLLAIPKFEMEYTAMLTDVLKEMGLSEIFQGGISGLLADDTELYIDDVMQKAKIKVDEKGTEAAAVTGIIAKMSLLKPENPEMIVNRPFLFTITTESEGIDQLLFAGIVSDLEK